jgi:hypothetical protein
MAVNVGVWRVFFVDTTMMTAILPSTPMTSRVNEMARTGTNHEESELFVIFC